MEQSTRSSQWSIKVLIKNKSRNDSCGIYFSLELSVESRTHTLQAVASYDIFYNAMEVNKTYRITNCEVESKKEYNYLPLDFKVILDEHTQVESCDPISCEAKLPKIHEPVSNWTLLDIALHQHDNICGKRFSVAAKVVFIKTDLDKVIYKACPSVYCKKKVTRTGHVNELYYCPKCNETFSTFQYRYMLKVLIADKTGKMWITMFEESERFLNISAHDIVKMCKTNPKEYENYILKRLEETYIFMIDVKMVIYETENRLQGVCEEYLQI